MSNQERINTLTSLRYAIEEYQGFTKSEKEYALTNLDSWLGLECRVHVFVEKFAEISLDVTPFLKERNFI